VLIGASNCYLKMNIASLFKVSALYSTIEQVDNLLEHIDDNSEVLVRTVLRYQRGNQNP
jgi:hypothetical protein